LHQLPAAEGAFLEKALLVLGKVGVVVDDEVVRGEEKAAGAAGRVADALARAGRDAVHRALDQGVAATREAPRR
jgi:hypothetical protein